MKTLTPRQLEVVALLIQGETQVQVAQGLGLSVHTVNDRLRDAKNDLGCATTFQLAFRLGCTMREALRKEAR